MRALTLVSLLVVAVSASIPEEFGTKFQEFKVKHGKTYKNQVEEAKRFAIFSDNLRAIEEHNARYEEGLETYTRAPNQFTDMTLEEFKAFLTLHPKPSFNTTSYVKRGVAVPESIDWRTLGQVTPVKNQGDCGSCWSFSVTGSTEAAYYRKSGNLVAFSEQQLIDCARDVNGGCDGGYLVETFPYIQEYGIQSEDTYPYQAADRTCTYDASQVVTKVDGYVSLTSRQESDLLEVVGTIGPVSAAVDVTYIGSYSSGIYSDSRCSTEPNHGVLIVGYGSEGGLDYWIIKNSWSTDWGEDGYYRLLRGSNACGVAADDVYPFIN